MFLVLAAGIIRRTIFDVWKQERCSSRKVETVLKYIRENTDFYNYEDLYQDKIRKVINNFCANLQQKWTKCHRNEKLFVKSNESWLLGKLKFDIALKKVAPGRPRKLFEECTESAKRKKVQHLVASSSKQELALATSLSL